MRFLLLIAFFISGFVSLVLETLWVKRFVLVFGGTTLAIVTVLTAFMGGLALGSFIASRHADKLKKPVKIYGFLEAGVALYALALPSFISLLPLLFQFIPQNTPLPLIASFRFLLSLFLLLLPTTLMGATLPVLSRYFVKQHHTIGIDAGILYSINTLGAVAGAFIAGFILLPLWGIQISLWLVSGILLLLAITMIIVGDHLNIANKEASPTKANDDEAILLEEAIQFEQTSFDEEHEKRLQKIVIFIIGVTGASAMIFQVIYSRALAMILGSSTYAFTLILVVFLMGLSLGAGAAAKLIKHSWDLIQSWCLFLVATAIIVALGSLYMDQLPLLFATFAFEMAQKANPLAFLVLKAFITAISLLIPTFLMGTFFPLALAIYSRRRTGISQSVGLIYTANTIGSIIGSILAGFLIIPIIGMQNGLALIVILYLLSAFSLNIIKKSENLILFGIILVIGMLSLFLFPRWNPAKMTLGMFRPSIYRYRTFQESLIPNKLLFYKEGMIATVSVEGTKDFRALKVNGKTDASNLGDRSTQIGVAALPLLFHEKAKEVLIVGWGSGMTVGAALFFPIKHLIAIELEPAVIEASHYFDRWNFQPLHHKNLTLILNDGRNYLSMSRKKYDIIISEPSNPWVSGVSNLFTVEYFTLVKSHLQKRGLFCQWIQTYELSYKNIVMLLRSLSRVFPYVYLFELEKHNFDKILLASQHPLKWNISQLTKVIQNPRYHKFMPSIGLHDGFDLIPRFLADKQEMKKIFRTTPPLINSDKHNILEYYGPFDLIRYAKGRESIRFDQAIRQNEMIFEKHFFVHQRPLTLQKNRALFPKIIMAHLRYGAIARADRLLKRIRQKKWKNPKLHQVHTLLKMMDGKIPPPALPPLIDDNDRFFWQKLALAIKFYQKDEPEQCSLILKLFTRPKYAYLLDKYPQTLFYLGICYRYSSVYDQALSFFQRYLQKIRQTGQKRQKK